LEPFDPELRVSGEGLPEFNDSFQKAYLAAPPEVQLKLRQVRNAHFGAGGVEGVLKNLGGKTIAEILEMTLPAAKVIDSGELDGISFTLYDRS
jgi:hypothetical protein